MWIKGITVTLYEKTQAGTDAANRPYYETTPVEIENVLVTPVISAEEMRSMLDMTGRRAVFTIGIPKGDKHNWLDSRVDFLGGSYRTFGEIEEGIEAMVPLEWHKKIKCEIYDGKRD